VLIGAAVFVAPLFAHAQTSWNASPYNYNNSPYNYNNSPYNFNNSPYNFRNSPYNMFSDRGIYGADGTREGYAVPRPDGGLNYFNNAGKRWGYSPGADE
jgi:hypothetical protein